MSAPAATVKYVRTDNAARILGIGKSTLEKLRLTGGGPSFRKLGKIVVYRIEDLEAWAEARAVSSTSEACRV